MINPDAIFGRLGNRMFQMAALYAYAQDRNADIYFQDKKWFEKYGPEIKSLFSAGIPERTERVSIHVRRGKNPGNPVEPAYSDNPFYINLTEGHHFHTDLTAREVGYDLGGSYEAANYYDRAIALFRGEKFLVFSDDLDFCRNYFQGENFEFFAGTELEDLNKMASCKANIIANSSFSWWAAYLNPNPDKKVVYPLKWFADGVERITFPPEWKGI